MQTWRLLTLGARVDTRRSRLSGQRSAGGQVTVATPTQCDRLAVADIHATGLLRANLLLTYTIQFQDIEFYDSSRIATRENPVAFYLFAFTVGGNFRTYAIRSKLNGRNTDVSTSSHAQFARQPVHQIRCVQGFCLGHFQDLVNYCNEMMGSICTRSYYDKNLCGLEYRTVVFSQRTLDNSISWIRSDGRDGLVYNS